MLLRWLQPSDYQVTTLNIFPQPVGICFLIRYHFGVLFMDYKPSLQHSLV